MLTVQQASDELQIKPGAVRDAVARGRLTPVRVGGGEGGKSGKARAGLLLFARAEIARYRAEHLGRRGRPPAREAASEPVARFADLEPLPTADITPSPDAPVPETTADSSADDLLTAKEAAAIIGIESGGVWKVAKDGKLASVGEGPDRRYPQTDVERYARKRAARRKKASETQSPPARDPA